MDYADVPVETEEKAQLYHSRLDDLSQELGGRSLLASADPDGSRLTDDAITSLAELCCGLPLALKTTVGQIALEAFQFRDRTAPFDIFVLHRLGLAPHALGQFNGALTGHSTVRKLASGFDWTGHMAASWNNSGNALNCLRRTEAAVEAYRRALELFTRIGHEQEQVRVWTNLGSVPEEAESARFRAPRVIRPWTLRSPFRPATAPRRTRFPPGPRDPP